MSFAAAQSGEALSQEFEELFREHYELLYRTAHGIKGNRHDAEDVLQSIFVKLLQNGLSPELRQHPARYLHRAAVNLSLNVLRARKRQKLVDGVDLEPGRYDWQVSVIEPAGGKAGFWQTPIAIVP